MEISASLVKDLREKTGLGVMDCKKALEESNGDLERAVEYLRKKGLKTAEKKSGRVTLQGRIGSYIHSDGKLGTLVELNCETDFAAQSEDFKELLKDLCMQVAAAAPLGVTSKDIPEEILAKEKEIYREQALSEEKPEKVVDKIVEGRLKKFYQEKCLMEQPFIRDDSMTVGDLITSKIAKIGENLSVRRFVRFRIGE